MLGINEMSAYQVMITAEAPRASMPRAMRLQGAGPLPMQPCQEHPADPYLRTTNLRLLRIPLRTTSIEADVGIKVHHASLLEAENDSFDG